MKRDWFRRGVRMSHPFGELERVNDPLGMGTFNPPHPVRVDKLSERGPMRDFHIQAEGEYSYREPPSAVVKPNGSMASINGPAPDYAQGLAMPVPVGTKRRLGPLRTDK
jgi:hypothetical protein